MAKKKDLTVTLTVTQAKRVINALGIAIADTVNNHTLISCGDASTRVKNSIQCRKAIDDYDDIMQQIAKQLEVGKVKK